MEVIWLKYDDVKSIPATRMPGLHLSLLGLFFKELGGLRSSAAKVLFFNVIVPSFDLIYFLFDNLAPLVFWGLFMA